MSFLWLTERLPGPRARQALSIIPGRDSGSAGLATLDSIEVFIRSVDHGSFSAAGRSLRFSAALVSHRI